jgi:hypothetical protein
MQVVVPVSLLPTVDADGRKEELYCGNLAASIAARPTNRFMQRREVTVYRQKANKLAMINYA